MATVSKTTRRNLVRAVADRYRSSTRPEKVRILDEFVALSGYHRKHAIRVLKAGEEKVFKAAPRTRTCLYDEAVRQALVVLWEASDRVCGKRLKPLLPLLVPSLERHGHLHLDATVREKVLRVGASTIDRLLCPARSIGKANGRRRGQAPAIRGSIPVRTFADWSDPDPGFMEVDLVSHCGGDVSGSFVHTLTLTDIASGWTECVALPVRESNLVVNAFERLRRTMPFPLRGIDSDNGSEFVNDVVLAFTQQAALEFTRSRPYRKNDQAWVEQKNGSVVRRMVGYGRLEGLQAAEALSRLYESSRLFVNFFQPSFKLRSKERIGARVRKNYHAPETPCARLLASPHVAEISKERLRAIVVSLDPLRLLDEIRTMQRHIAVLAAGLPAHTPPRRDGDLDSFMAGLVTAWRAGEVRPTHERSHKPARYWRTRIDPLADVWPQDHCVARGRAGSHRVGAAPPPHEGHAWGRRGQAPQDAPAPCEGLAEVGCAPPRLCRGDRPHKQPGVERCGWRLIGTKGLIVTISPPMGGPNPAQPGGRGGESGDQPKRGESR